MVDWKWYIFKKYLLCNKNCNILSRLSVVWWFPYGLTVYYYKSIILVRFSNPIKQTYICKPLYKFVSLIYFSYKLNCHTPDEVLYNGRMLRSHFALGLFHVLIWKFLIKYDNICSIFHSDKFLYIYKCWNRFVSEMILLFSIKI